MASGRIERSTRMHKRMNARTSACIVAFLCGHKRARLRPETRLPDEDCCGHDRRPETFLVADRRLRHVLSADDLVRETIDFLFFVPALVGIEFEAEGRREHFGREFFGIVAGDVLALAKAVM